MAFDCQVLKNIGTISTSKSGWVKELLCVKHNDMRGYSLRKTDPYGRPRIDVFLTLAEIRELHHLTGMILDEAEGRYGI